MIEITEAAVVLDLDDTLYLERDFAYSGFKAVGRHLGARLASAEFAKTCSDLLNAGVRRNVFDLALREFDIVAEQELIDDLVAVYRNHSPLITLCADAERFLGRLGEKVTGLISDGPEQTQAAKVKALGLAERIDHICLTGSWPEGYGKPHPRAFETIQGNTGLSAPNHVYIADNGAKDFLAAKRLGWRTVQILRSERVHDCSPPTPDHAADSVVTTLDEIKVIEPEAAIYRDVSSRV